MQCLRYTPGLPLMVLPDLLDAAAQQQQQQPDSQPPTPTKGRASRTSSLS